MAPVPPPYYVTDPTQDGTDGFRTFVDHVRPRPSCRPASSSGITNFTGTYSYVVLPDDARAGHQPSSARRSGRSNTVPQAQPRHQPRHRPRCAQLDPTSRSRPSDPEARAPLSTKQLPTSTSPAYNNQTISGLTVNINIADPTNGLGDIGDLFIGLITPNGIGIVLYYKPGDTNKNLTNVTFSDRASQSIEVASGPYTNGTFESYNPLTLANGGPVNGTYTLFIDNFSIDQYRNAA